MCRPMAGKKRCSCCASVAIINTVYAPYGQGTTAVQTRCRSVETKTRPIYFPAEPVRVLDSVEHDQLESVFFGITFIYAYESGPAAPTA